jgi:Flp pilus assembly pilin Flp
MIIFKTSLEENMKHLLVRLWKDESGQDTTEYALLLALIAVASIAAMNSIATAIQTVFGAAATDLNAAT